MNRRPKAMCEKFRGGLVAATIGAAFLIAIATPVSAEEFSETLARVDHALKTNPSRVLEHALISCEARRRTAVELYRTGHDARARRSLKFCLDVLQIPETGPAKQRTAGTTRNMDQIQAQAARELEKALALTPDPEKGLRIYRECAACHQPEGWGLVSGAVPQLAGQHRKVVIKQLADIRAGNRDNVLMIPYSSVESIGGAQSVADVAAYIDTLEISVDTGKGPGDDLEFGESVYRENCARCHGEAGEGNNDLFVPRIQAQHYRYLLRQFEWIRDGRRRNANPEMAAQIQGFEDRQTHAVLDYVSRLDPPVELQAPPGWHNPDFAD